MENEEYFYSPNGKKFSGNTYCSEGLEEEKLPSVILAHGLNSRALDLRVDYRALSAKGFRRFAYDFGGAITTIAKITYSLQPKVAILEYPALSFTDETPAHLKDIGRHPL